LAPADPDLVEHVHALPDPALRDDPKFAAARIPAFQYSAVGIFLFLISGFWTLQVQNPEFYNEQAERNHIKSQPIPAGRGKILDRDGRVIVDNHDSFRLILARDNLKMEHLRAIAAGLDLDYDDLLATVRRYQRRPKYENIVVKEELTAADLAFVESHRDPEFFPELELIHSQRRLYPGNGFAAHLIGYTGEISEQELDTPEYARHEPGDVIGKFGIEREYNDKLMGADGQRQVLVDNHGDVRKVLGLKDAVPGHDLQLTIDLDLQAVAELAMDGKKGAVVAMDPRTGEVLAMVSRPAFDPNQFAGRIPQAVWNRIVENREHPLMNRAIQAQFAPGSTFKPIVALAGLETHSIESDYTVSCAGGATFYGHYHKCHLKSGHGAIGLVNAIEKSCDVFFYNVGNRAGIDNIANYAHAFGLGYKTGIDLPQEKAGVIPSTQWKLRTSREKWYAGETISVAIGQGAVTVTPMQLARAYSAIANHGPLPAPHVVKKGAAGGEKPSTVKLDPENLARVIAGTCLVVNGGGTGTRARLPDIEVCGKTGTAQLASNDFVRGKSSKDLEDNAWFVGFAPRAAPEIVCVALFENGGESYLAVPIVRDVLKAYFDKKARRANTAPPRPQPSLSTWLLPGPPG
jgi:penicillin-binding protein 2